VVVPCAIHTLQGFIPGKKCSETQPALCFRLKKGFFTRKSAIKLCLGFVLMLVAVRWFQLRISRLSCTRHCKTRAEDAFVHKELAICSVRSQMDTTRHGEQTADTGQCGRHKNFPVEFSVSLACSVEGRS